MNIHYLTGNECHLLHGQILDRIGNVIGRPLPIQRDAANDTIDHFLAGKRCVIRQPANWCRTVTIHARLPFAVRRISLPAGLVIVFSDPAIHGYRASQPPSTANVYPLT